MAGGGSRERPGRIPARADGVSRGVVTKLERKHCGIDAGKHRRALAVHLVLDQESGTIRPCNIGDSFQHPRPKLGRQRGFVSQAENVMKFCRTVHSAPLTGTNTVLHPKQHNQFG